VDPIRVLTVLLFLISQIGKLFGSFCCAEPSALQINLPAFSGSSCPSCSAGSASSCSGLAHRAELVRLLV
jgi:hypothetical protein